MTVLFMLFPGRDVGAGPVWTLGGSLLATGVPVACLGVLDVEKLLLGGCRSAVPRAGAVASLDAGEELGLVPVDVLLRDPVHPETLVRRGDVAGDHGTARDLALTAHLVPVVQALLLGGAQGVPGHDEVTERDVHLAVPLGLSWGDRNRQAQDAFRLFLRICIRLGRGGSVPTGPCAMPHPLRDPDAEAPTPSIAARDRIWKAGL